MWKVYCFDITDEKELAIKDIPSNIRKFVQKYKQPNARKLSCYSWIYLEQVLQKEWKINLEEKTILQNKNGKPYIDGIYFNLSHSGNMIAIVIGTCEVGIDIEAESNMKKYWDLKYFSEWLNEEEIVELNKAENQLEYLTKAWTKKEALLKKKGVGIQSTADMRSVQGEVTTYLKKDKNKETYIVSIAS